ncbi:MAG: hypothetical protein CMJ42_16585 [Phyllobacteriaceae bacterium]|jgi:muconolactone delta-isomerase|nr:hypothetical protein [Phyllobacteriaceae bacterium]RME01184.1 MAG: hypothetical protein D6816_12685 [Bacteroidota bacterium]
MPYEQHYMVDFTLPKVLSEEFLQLIPMQRNRANKLFREGKLVNFAVAIDNSKMWAVLNASSLEEVEVILQELPLTRLMRYKVSCLTMFSAADSGSPAFSLN